MKTYLKIKICSLAAEAQIIRKHERRATGDLRAGLHNHRVVDVRIEQRAALLAYAFLRGRAYHQLEPKCHQPPDWKRVERMIQKYGTEDSRTMMQRFSEWRETKPALAA